MEILALYLQKYLTKIFIQPESEKLHNSKTKFCKSSFCSSKKFSYNNTCSKRGVITVHLKNNYVGRDKMFRELYSLYFDKNIDLIWYASPKYKNAKFSLSVRDFFSGTLLHCNYLLIYILDQQKVNKKQTSCFIKSLNKKANKNLYKIYLFFQISSPIAQTFFIFLQPQCTSINLLILNNFNIICKYLTKKISTFYPLAASKRALHFKFQYKTRTILCIDVKPKGLSFYKIRLLKSRSYLLVTKEICPQYIQLMRPLLSITRFNTFYLCEILKLPVHPDKSNLKLQFLRNRVRKQILPAIRILINPQFDTIMCNFNDSFFNKR